MRASRDVAAFVIMVLLFFLVASEAFGQECRERTLSNQPHYMPTGLFCEIGDGMTCFNLDEYKRLLLMDTELYTEKEKVRELNKIVENQGLIIRQKDLIIGTLDKDKEILREQNERIGEKWRTCLEEQEGVPWSSIGLGAAAGVLTGVAAALTTYFIVTSVK